MSLPPGLGFLQIASSDCRSCLKECLGIKVQKAQVISAKIQAPLSLVTWYLFQNRPFKMWPLENVISQLAKVRRWHWPASLPMHRASCTKFDAQIPPAIFGGLGGGLYMSCQHHCDEECPYPGKSRTKGMPPKELEGVDAEDPQLLYQLFGGGGGRRGSRSGGGLGAAFSEFFRVV